ncbi:MAG: prepilin peptidase [Halovenus sp.]
MLDVATVPDLLRLLVLPFFGYVAWRDIETRRVPDKTWLPLAALAVVLLVWETIAIVTGDATSIERQRYYIRVGLSLGFIIPLSYLFWLMGGFGGADAKAFFIIAALFPTYPEYTLAEIGIEGTFATLPIVQTTIGVFALTILSNTVLAGLGYPVGLAIKNALTGYVSPGMFIAKPIQSGDAIEEYGSVLEFPDRGLLDDLSLSGLRSYFSWRGLDLDALRMYLQWRGCSFAELTADPAAFRDPDSLPAEPNPPGDGSFVVGEGGGHFATDGGTDIEEREFDDPWGAAAFLDDIEGTAYGTTPEDLRDGLDHLTSSDVVWISPGIPFLVPLFVGLLVSFSYGDLLFSILGAVGLA